MKNTIRVERARNKISQKKLADAINVSRQSIHLIENDLMTPKLNMACKIARFFNLKVDEKFEID